MNNAPVSARTVRAEDDGRNMMIITAADARSPIRPSLKGINFIDLIPITKRQGVSMTAILFATTAANATLPDALVVKEMRYAPIKTSEVTRLAVRWFL